MKVKIKKLHPDAKIPTYGSDGAAAFDIYACEPAERMGLIAVRTGISIEVPEGHAMFIKPRSGMAFKSWTEAFAGTIDSDYRGEIIIQLTSMSMHPIVVACGDRIAQAVILPVPRVEFIEVEELSATERGAKGFGSTGV